MDPAVSAPDPDRDRITLTPDMRPLGADRSVEVKPTPPPASPPRRQGGRWGLALGLLGLVAGLGAVAFSVWTYNEGQKEILRLSTELAQLRVSLDLYARNGTSAADLTSLGQRVEALESGALGTTVPMPATAQPPEETTTAMPSATEDCLPSGMRLLVASGDSYPICGQSAEVAISAVANGYITLGDGTSVASGGTAPLPGNPACTLAVTSGGDEGLTGYAEIRVTC